MKKLTAYAAAYIAAITAANLLVAHYGPAISVANAFALIGVDLALRDLIDDELRGKRWPMLTIILASTADWAVYRALRGRAAWSDRANASNTVGAAVDSAIFPLLAFGWPPLWIVMIGQFAAKVGGGAVFVLIIDAARRHRAARAAA